LVSPLDIRYRFVLGRWLNKQERALWDTVPGFAAANKSRQPWVEAPLDAAWLAEQMLRVWNVPYVIRPTGEFKGFRRWGADAEEQLIERIRDSDVRGWLVGLEAGPWELLPFQREAIWFAVERGGCALLREEAGAGKTVQAAVVAGLAPPGPVLVVTRDGSPVPQWCREAQRFLKTTAHELRPVSRRRKKDGTLLEYLARRKEVGERPVVVCGWATLRVCVDELLAVGHWSQIVFDESHRAKSAKRRKYTRIDGEWSYKNEGGQSAAAARLAEIAGARLCTTATPIPDLRRDLWGQFSLIVQGGWGGTRSRFGTRYCAGHDGAYGFDDTGVSNTPELESRMSFFFHDVPKEVSHGQLPPCRVEACYVPVERQDKPAAGFKRDMKRLAKESAGGKSGASGELRELQLAEAATRKRTEVKAVTQEYASRGRVTLFTGRHRDCWELGESLRKQFKKGRATRHIRVLVAVDKHEDGTYSLPSVAERQKMLLEYQSEEHVVLVGTAKAWGESLDGLQCSDLLGVVMLPWSPGDLVQWMGRVTRLGQDRPVTIMLFIAEQTVDDRVGASLMAKVPDAVRLGGNIELSKTRNAVLGLDDKEAMKELVRKITEGPEQEFDWA
jgi:hypothetical protein